MRIFIIFIFLFFAGRQAYASCVEQDKGFWNNEQGRGWFWGETECQPVVTDDDNQTEKKADWKILPKKSNIPWGIIDELDPEEISTKIEPEAKKISVMYPTEENIIEYRKLTNWIVKKASQYATIDERIRIENPSITPNLELAPISQIKNNALFNYKNSEIDQALAQYKDRAGMVIYESKSCQYCKLQKPIIDMFQTDYGWEVIYKEISESPAEAAKFNVKTTPDIFLVLRDTNGSGLRYQRIATGLTTLDALKTSILKGLGYLGETINETLINY